ncbi:ADP-ribosylglycohydrolase family protein [Nocardia salmonicida]|uniref:ADP-ribosylglycohydrolase family protein n=1 Tax=Nocardia salmonicida TaxID=53431 RepID=UPI0033E85C63
MADRQYDRARGIVLGAACGDALGWPQELRGGIVGGQKVRESREPIAEFTPWVRTARYRQTRYHDEVRAGEYSDDTQLLIATARACLHGDRWFDRLVGVELPMWPVYQRGGGGAVLRAAAAWAGQTPPWRASHRQRSGSQIKRYRDAGANGVAMRIAPHAIYSTAPNQLVERVITDGLATHGHPRALVGALTYAHLVAYAMRSTTLLGYGELLNHAADSLIPADEAIRLLPKDWGLPSDIDDFQQTWTQTNEEMRRLIDIVEASVGRGSLSSPTETLINLGCGDPSVNGAGTVTAAGALYLASRFAARPETGLVTAAFLPGGDTDTLASMTGALLGAIHGQEWLGPLARNVQDGEYLSRLATDLVTRRSEPDLPSAQEGPAPRVFADSISLASNNSTGKLPDGRSYRIVAIETPSATIRRRRLETLDRQTMIVTTGLSGSNRRTDATDSSEHTRPAHTREHVVQVVLVTQNLKQCAEFYSVLLDRKDVLRGDSIEILPGLFIRSTREGEDAGGSHVIVLAVKDPEAAARRVADQVSYTDRGTPTVNDPDGRRLILQPVHR